MQKQKKLSARILSLALSVAMVTTMLPMAAFAAKDDASAIGTIQSFDKLEDRFIPSVGENAPNHVYGLSVAPNTPVEDLNLPNELTAMVARTTTVSPPAEDEPVVDSGKPSEPAVDETIPDEDTVVEGATDETVSDNQPAVPSDAEEGEGETTEINEGNTPLAPEPEQNEETIATTVAQEIIPVTWQSDKEYVSPENGQFIYTAVLTEGYLLADGVELPQIYVAVGKQARAAGDAITIEVNTITAGGATLEAAITGNGVTATAVETLKITAGKVTEDDWKYLKSLTAMKNFEIAEAITDVKNIPEADGNFSTFPKSIVTVTIPQEITISKYAFENCTSLETVNAPMLSAGGSVVFRNCTSLTEISLPNLSTMGEGMFDGCTALKTVNIPLIESVPDDAFYGCAKLETVSFPKVTAIGMFAFAGCTSLASASFPAATSIGETAFIDCSKLTTLKLGATPPATVGDDAFEACPTARALGYVDASNNALTGNALTKAQEDYKAASDGNTADGTWHGWTITLADYIGTQAATPNSTPSAKTATSITLAAVTAPSGETIEYAKSTTSTAPTTGWQDSTAFAGLTANTEYYFFARVKANTIHKAGTTSVGTAITTEGESGITLVAKISGIETTLSGESLGYLLDNSGVRLDLATTLKITGGKVTFEDWKNMKYFRNLKTFEIDRAVTEVADTTNGFGDIPLFGDNSKHTLKSIIVPQAIAINWYAFSGCRVLEDVSIYGVTSIAQGAFFSSSAIINITLPATPPTVATKAFSVNSGANPLNFADANGDPLTGIDLVNAQNSYKAVPGEDNNTSDDLWYGWKIGAPKVTFTATIDGNETFLYGDSLFTALSTADPAKVTALKIAAGEVTEEDWGKLKTLTALTTLEIASVGTTVANIPEGSSDNGIFPESITSVIVPQAITIGKYAFDGCTELTTASFPVVTSIGDSAFNGCSKLATTSFPEVTSIGNSAFNNCAELTTASFPVVTSIGELAFNGCSKLATASLPVVASIGDSAFNNCSKLSTLKLDATPPETVGTNVFLGCPSPRTLLYVAADGNLLAGDALTAAQTAYKGVSGEDNNIEDNLWYGCTVAVPVTFTATIDGVETELYGESLSQALPSTDLAKVTALKITAGEVTEDDWNSLHKLSALATFEINAAVTDVANVPNSPDSTTFPKSIVTVTVPQAITIGTRAFYQCTALTSVDFQKATSIGIEAFSGCAALTDVNFPVVTNIGLEAFCDCVELTDVSFPVATSIGDSAFSGCVELTDVSFPVATSIGNSAFSGCVELTTARFPVATSIGDSAFSGCAKLATLKLGATPPATVGTDAFKDCLATRALGYVDATGNDLLGEVLTTVQGTYKGVRGTDNNITDNLWYGWTIVSTHTITASAGTGGSISPSGAVTVKDSESKTFTISPNSNYSIASVLIDGVNKGVTSTYTFNDVTENHTISATFSSTGGSGGGSPSNGSSTTPTTKPTEPVTGSSNADATIDKNGNATVNVSDKNISDAVKAAKDAASKKGVNAGEVTAVINVTSPANSNSNTVTVNLPKTVQQQVISDKIDNVAIVIDKPDISIGMNLATITEMNKQANADIQLSATRTDATKLSIEAKNAIGNRPAFDLKATYASGAKSITSFGSGTVSVAIPYTLQDGEVAGGLSAVYVDDDGKVEYITGSSYDTNTQMLHFVTNHFSVYGVGYEAPIDFMDIADHWAKADIAFVVSRGLMSGTSNTTFAPNTAMTRGMFVTALGRLSGMDVNTYETGKFADVKTDAYYAPYVNWAAEKGIVKGISDTNFVPDQSITRQEMAVIMSNYAKAMGYTIPETRDAITFADNGSIGSWASDAVKQMQMAGILSGKDGNKFDPTGTATRGEISAMLHRYVELVIDK